MIALDGKECGDRCAAKYAADYPTVTQYNAAGEVIRYGSKAYNGVLICFSCGATWVPKQNLKK